MVEGPVENKQINVLLKGFKFIKTRTHTHTHTSKVNKQKTMLLKNISVDFPQLLGLFFIAIYNFQSISLFVPNMQIIMHTFLDNLQLLVRKKHKKNIRLESRI